MYAKKLLALIGLVVLVIILGAWWQTSPTHQPKETEIGIFESKTLRLKIEVPLAWEADLRYPVVSGEPTGLQGSDGFVYFDLLHSEKDLDLKEVAKRLAEDPNQSYGSNARVEERTIADKKFVFVWPSDDQPAVKQKEVAIVYKYPKEIELNGSKYQVLVILADKAHAEEIADSLTTTSN